jgi:hypothetical protein
LSFCDKNSKVVTLAQLYSHRSEGNVLESQVGGALGTASLHGPLTWFSAASLRLVHEVNFQVLELLCLGGAACGPFLPLAKEVGQKLAALGDASRRKIARCPLVLLDAKFQDEARWRGAASRGLAVRDALDPPVATRSEPAVRLAHVAFISAWTIARGDASAAELMLGMSRGCAMVISNVSLQQLRELAQEYWHWVEPRRADRPDIWRALVEMSGASGISPLCDPGLRAWQLFLGEQASNRGRAR